MNIDQPQRFISEKFLNDTTLSKQLDALKIKNIDMFGKFKLKNEGHRFEEKRFKTAVVSTKLNFEKFTNEITKLVEEVKDVSRTENKKRTIKFATQKVTYQYEKVESSFVSNKDQNEKENIEDKIEEEKEDNIEDKNEFKFEDLKEKKSNENIFVFNDEEDDK